MKATYIKIARTFLMLILTLAVQLNLTSCGGGGSDPAPVSKQEEVKAKLTSAAWKATSVTVDGTDKTSVYSSLNIQFSATGFTTTNGGAVWPVSGTWSFTSADAIAFKRDDGLIVNIQETTDTSLKLALTWSKTTIGPGRTESVSGAHVFSFGK